MRDNVINKTKSNGILVAESGKRQISVQHDFPCKLSFLCVLFQEVHAILRRVIGLFSFLISGNLSSPPPGQTGLLLPAGGQRLQAPHPLLQARLARRHVTVPGAMHTSYLSFFYTCKIFGK